VTAKEIREHSRFCYQISIRLLPLPNSGAPKPCRPGTDGLMALPLYEELRRIEASLFHGSAIFGTADMLAALESCNQLEQT